MKVLAPDAYKLLVEAIVRGQVSDFVNAHPGILDCVLWYKPNTDKKQVFINSVSKRIIAALTSDDTIAKIQIALVDGLLPEHTADAALPASVGDRESVTDGTSGALPSSNNGDGDEII